MEAMHDLEGLLFDLGKYAEKYENQKLIQRVAAAKQALQKDLRAKQEASGTQ